VKEIITEAVKRRKKLIEGNTALIVVDIQGGSVKLREERGVTGLVVEGWLEMMRESKKLIEACRKADIPIIWIQEFHRKNLVDFGRETDGTEAIHELEGDPTTAIIDEVAPHEGEYIIRKTRYNCFMGTGLEFWLNGVNVLPGDTLIFCGGMTNVCIHYSAAEAHQRDYHIRVVEECTAGSSRSAHEAALEQIEYLQTGGRTKLADILEAIGEYKPVRPQKPGSFSGFTQLR
jgi:nicotinamidase-related amidase